MPTHAASWDCIDTFWDGTKINVPSTFPLPSIWARRFSSRASFVERCPFSNNERGRTPGWHHLSISLPPVVYVPEVMRDIQELVRKTSKTHGVFKTAMKTLFLNHGVYHVIDRLPKNWKSKKKRSNRGISTEFLHRTRNVAPLPRAGTVGLRVRRWWWTSRFPGGTM